VEVLNETFIIRFFYIDFIVALERDYPSTVNAIARTCGKLVPKGESAESRCVLCQR
jgi:cytoplasmic tRNA 2-thiolation protein 2